MGPTLGAKICDDGVASGIAESRESPSAIINREITAMHDELRSLLHVKGRIDYKPDKNRPIRKRKTSGITRDEDETIRETRTLSSARDEDETIRETKLQLICEMKTRQRAKRRRDDTRDRDGAIRAVVRNAPAKTRPRDNTSETIHEDEERAMRDEQSWTIRDKVMI